MSRKFSSSGRLAWRALKEALSMGFARRERQIWSCCPAETDSCSPNSARIARRKQTRLQRNYCIASKVSARRQASACTRRPEAKAVWHIREAGPRAAAFAPGAPAEWEGWDDAAVPPEKLGGYLRDIRALMNEYQISGSFLRAFRAWLRAHARHV